MNYKRDVEPLRVTLGSGGNKMKAVLDDNKQDTYSALASFQQYMVSFDAKQYGVEFSQKVYSVLNKLNELSSKRTAVAGLSITKEEAISYYTTLNGNFIKSIECVSLLANHPKISAHTHTMVSFISAKEDDTCLLVPLPGLMPMLFLYICKWFLC